MKVTRARRATVSGALAAELAAAGVRVIFGLVGEDTVALVAELQALGVRYVGVRHEATAVAMADGYAWATGGPAVCTVTRGPGLTNALTACRTAVQARRGVLVITGEAPAAQGGAFYKDIDQRAVCASIGLEYFAATSPDDALTALRRALRAARDNRAAALALPSDTLSAAWTGEKAGVASTFATPPPPPGAEEIAAVVRLAAAAERPLILGGDGAATPGARDALSELARRTGGLLGTTLLAKGLFHGDPLALGVVGGFAADPAVPVLAEIDLVLAFGASLNPFTTAHGTLFARAPIVHVDLGEAKTPPSVPVTLSIKADAEGTARALLDAMPSASGPRALHQPETLARIAGAAYEGPDESTADRLDPRTLSRFLDALLPEDRVVVLDSGRFMTAPGRFVGVQAPGSVRHTADGGSIGLGLGVALGAALGRPERPTVLFAGDGGFSMALADLETAARHTIPLIMVVCDNEAYGSELHVLAAAGLPAGPALLPAIDFAGVAGALGIEAATVETVHQVEALGPRLRSRTSPLLVHARIMRDLVVPRLTW